MGILDTHHKQNLIRLARFYPKDFSPIELMVLNDQHETHVIDVRYNGQFPDLKVPGDLARKMVQTKKKTHCLLGCYIFLEPTGCNYIRGDNIFCYEYCEKSATKVDGRSMDERSISCVYRN